MKILYVNGKNNNGGANIALLNIVKGMLQKGHEVHVITDNHPGFFLGEIKKTACTLHTCSCALNIRVSNKVKNPITIFNYYAYHLYTWFSQKRFINHVIQEIKPDVVHTNIGPLTTAAEVCIELGIPHVWHIREYGVELGYHIFPSKTHFHKLLYNDKNYCIAITKGIFGYYNMRYNHDCCIYDGVFPQTNISQAILKEKKDYILFVGRIEEAKGVKELLDAYILFRKKEKSLRLLLAGSFDLESSYYKACLKIIEANDLQDCVEFLGIRNDIYILMSRAKFLVVPSPMEGFGFITAEAMLNYCPVIGKDCYGTKEQFDNGLIWTGGEIAYRYQNMNELVNCMHKAINENTDEMVFRAHKVLTNYTIEHNVMQIECFYNKLIKR